MLKLLKDVEKELIDFPLATNRPACFNYPSTLCLQPQGMQN